MPKYSRKYATEDLDGALAIAALQDAAENENDPEAQKLLSEGDYTKILSSLKNLRNIETLKSSTTAAPVSVPNSAGTSPERSVLDTARQYLLKAGPFGSDEEVARYKESKGNADSYAARNRVTVPDTPTGKAFNALMAAGEFMPTGGGAARAIIPALVGAYTYLNPPNKGQQAATQVGAAANTFQNLITSNLPGAKIAKLPAAAMALASGAGVGAGKVAAANEAAGTDINPVTGALVGGAASLIPAVGAYKVRGEAGAAVPVAKEIKSLGDAAWSATSAAAKAALKQPIAGSKTPAFDKAILQSVANSDGKIYDNLSTLFREAGISASGPNNTAVVQEPLRRLNRAIEVISALPGGKENLRKTFGEYLNAEMKLFSDSFGPANVLSRLRTITEYGSNKDIFDKIFGKDGTEKMLKYAAGLDTRMAGKSGGPGVSYSAPGVGARVWDKLTDILPLDADKMLRQSIDKPTLRSEYLMDLLQNPMSKGGAGREIVNVLLGKEQR